jgi:HEAT repeat protein
VRPLSPELRSLIEQVQADSRPNAIRELAKVLREAPTETFSQLALIRCPSEWQLPSQWNGLDTKRVARLAQLPDGWAALGIASLHASGYVREAAVRALAWHDEGDELPFLLLRLNDWVQQVRDAALAAVRARRTIHYAVAWIRALPLVDALRAQRRADHRSLVADVETLLRSPDARPALLRGLAANNVTTRRACFRLALEFNDDDLLKRALSDADVVVRCNAAARVQAVSAGERRQSLVDRIVADRSATVRRYAVQLLALEPEPWRHTRLEALGCDPSASIRAAARPLLAIDWAERYRLLLGDRVRQRAAIAGLGECGLDEDVLLLEPFLLHALAKTRSAALSATAALDRESVAPFVDALADPSKRVSRSAARILQKRFRLGLPDLVLALAERSDVPAHARIHALDAMSSLRFWPRLLWMLSATASPCRELAELAAARISAVGGERPSHEELAAIERALRQSPLPSARVVEIRRELSFWR